MDNTDYLKRIEAMGNWWLPFSWYTKFKKTLLKEGMYQTVADEIQRCLNIKEYEGSDYLIKKLCETGEFWDWDKYYKKVVPAYAFSQSKRKPGTIPGDFPSALQVKRDSLRYTKNKDNFVIEGVVYFEEKLNGQEIYLKRDLI